MRKKRLVRSDLHDYDTAHHRSGGPLKIPKTPVAKVMLRAKLMKMKSDYLERQAGHGD